MVVPVALRGTRLAYLRRLPRHLRHRSLLKQCHSLFCTGPPPGTTSVAPKAWLHWVALGCCPPFLVIGVAASAACGSSPRWPAGVGTPGSWLRYCTWQRRCAEGPAVRLWCVRCGCGAAVRPGKRHPCCGVSNVQAPSPAGTSSLRAWRARSLAVFCRRGSEATLRARRRARRRGRRRDVARTLRELKRTRARDVARQWCGTHRRPCALSIWSLAVSGVNLSGLEMDELCVLYYTPHMLHS